MVVIWLSHFGHTCAPGSGAQLTPGCRGSCRGLDLWFGEASLRLGVLVKDFEVTLAKE